MDPYYKKLAFKGKKYFWKIYSKVTTSSSFKDIFEKMSGHNPEERPDSSQVMEHEFAADSPCFSEEIEREIQAAYKNLEEVLGDNMDPFTDEIPGTHRTDDDADPEREEWVRHDDEEFEKLRNSLITEVQEISKILRKRRFMKHVSKNQEFYGSSEPYSSNNKLY